MDQNQSKLALWMIFQTKVFIDPRIRMIRFSSSCMTGSDSSHLMESSYLLISKCTDGTQTHHRIGPRHAPRWVPDTPLEKTTTHLQTGPWYAPSGTSTSPWRIPDTPKGTRTCLRNGPWHAPNETLHAHGQALHDYRITV